MPICREPETRWSWVEIDQGALRRNARAFKNLLKPGQRLCCVVKADAYGHGAAKCARIMYAAGADMFAVATVMEGVELRQSGIKCPILVLSEPPATAAPLMLENDIMPSLYSVEFALAYGEAAVAQGKVGKYHLAIETGMNRIGVDAADVVEFMRTIGFHRGLECAGVFTHFATADEPQGWDYGLQRSRFIEAVRALEDAGIPHGLVHCDNTPASILDPATHFDMIRAGVGLYGMQPCARTASRIEIEPVMSVRARITRTRKPVMGEGVGYGATYRVPHVKTQVCTVPLGYADGLRRMLSNRMEVLCRGRRVKQVGNICMDQFMVAFEQGAVSSAPEAEIGDLVTIVGRDGSDRITMDDLAALCGTINYEMACGFGMRLEKVYV